MDEGQCFRCGRVPRLCVCPEGPMLEPRARTDQAEMKLRPYQRVALKMIAGSLGLDPKDIQAECGITTAEAQALRAQILERYPRLRTFLEPHPVVLHVHDSIEVESPPEVSAEQVAEAKKVMELLPREAEPFLESPQRFKYRLLKDGQFIEQERRAVEMGTEIHQALATLLKFGMEISPVTQSEEDEAVAEKVHFALRLAKLQANYESNVDEDVTTFLARHGITDIYNVPKKWSEVQWRGKTYLLCELEDEEGIVTPFGLYLDWPAPTPDIKDDPDWNRGPEA